MNYENDNQAHLSKRDAFKVTGAVILGGALGLAIDQYLRYRRSLDVAVSLATEGVVTTPWNQGEINGLDPLQIIPNVVATLTPEVTRQELESTPEAPLLVDGYILGTQDKGFINLADSKRAIVAVLAKRDGAMYPSTPAWPYAWTGSNAVFKPAMHTLLSHSEEGDGNATYTWAHSGEARGKLFADNIVRLLRLHNGRLRTTWEAWEFIQQEIIGVNISIHQEQIPGIFPYDWVQAGVTMDTYRNHSNVLVCQIAAAAIVPHERILDYEDAIRYGQRQWLLTNPAEVLQSGWETFNPRTHWTLKTCIGKFAGQEHPGLVDVGYNRLMLSMVPVSGYRDPIFDPRVPYTP